MHNLYGEILSNQYCYPSVLQQIWTTQRTNRLRSYLAESCFIPLIVETRATVIRARAQLQKNEESLQNVRLIFSGANRGKELTNTEYSDSTANLTFTDKEAVEHLETAKV